MSRPVAEVLRPLVNEVLGGEPPVKFAFWDGSSLGTAVEPGYVTINSPDALRRVLYQPGLLGLARAYVSGDLDIKGDTVNVLDALYRMKPKPGGTFGRLKSGLGIAKELGVFGKPVPPPSVEHNSKRRFLHSKTEDADSIDHHYNVGNDFYRLFLGPSMAYTCARYETEDMSLDDAQVSKFDLICRKLGLQPGMRYLDVGCGWAGMLIHAAKHYGVEAVGVTISTEQAQWCRDAIKEAGVEDKVTIQLIDYRELDVREKFDAVSSVGFLEHVGHKNSSEYFTRVKALLKPGGRVLTQAISKVGGAATNAFNTRYIFPGGELQDIVSVLDVIEESELEVVDVESLRSHYDRTCTAWVANLVEGWDHAVELVGLERARAWLLYMAGSAVFFRRNAIGLFQTLAVNTDDEGQTRMPLTRASYV